MNSSIYNNYPRIFSLSTVGIKYHGYQDYLFHPTRTDFVGESGYGKSMIGDMLQLIFVGAREFRSGTRVDTGEERKPEGMVLEQKRQNSIGYIFLNIEVSSNRFIVIGIYIEANIGRTAPFIIQAGYNWEGDSALLPLSMPITHKEFLQDEMLMPIEAFEEKVRNQLDSERLIIRSFRNNLKLYHTILCQNNILPIDLGSDNYRLRDYAQILQSFARGKGFKSDSASLKSFLFGDQDSGNISDQFAHESKQLKISIEQYYKNKEQIAELRLVGETLEILEKISQQCQKDRQALLTADAMMSHRVLESFKVQMREASSSLNFVYKKLLALRSQELTASLKKQEQDLNTYRTSLIDLAHYHNNLNEVNAMINRLAAEEKTLILQCQEANANFTKLQEIEKWLEKYESSPQKLLQYFTTQMRACKEKEQLDSLIIYLQERDLFTIFEASIWAYDCELARIESKKYINKLDQEIELLASLKMFSNVSDPNSLARWALEKDAPLTIEQESALLYFQTLPRTEIHRKKGERFLPNPDEVFTKLTIINRQEDGFWLGLAGVNEFVPIRSLQLTSENKLEIRKYLEEKLAEFDKRYDMLVNEKEKIEKLEKALQTYGYNQVHAALFINRVSIGAFIPDEKLPNQQAEFDEYYALLLDSKVVYAAHHMYNTAYDEAKEQLETLYENRGRLNEKIKLLVKETTDKEEIELERAIQDTQEELNGLQKEFQNSPIESKYCEELAVFEKTIHLASLSECQDLRLTLSNEETRLKTKLEGLEQDLPDLEKSFQMAKSRFESELLIKFLPQQKAEIIDVNLAKLAFETSDRNFKNKLDAFINKYADSERHRLEDETNVGHIAHIAFPKVFPRAQEAQITVAEQITRSLESLNEKNRELDASSSETVSRIFRGVRKTYDQYIEKINRLRNFFSQKNTQITGGYNVKLSFHSSKQYPISWINELEYNLSLANTPLYASAIRDDSLQEIVINTFTRYTSGTKSPELKRLLDPKSYFELDFTLENSLGTTHGSEGQAYTAIALLCIARLSLIEGKSGKKSPGVRFMPIDEAEGIGSNYQTLYNLAVIHNYQVVTMSINSVAGAKEGGQTTYTLIPNPDSTSGVNCDPFYHLGYHHEHAQKFYNNRIEI